VLLFHAHRYDNPAVQSAVRSLIEEEMAAIQPRNYLAHLPPPPDLSFPDNPVLASEVRRRLRMLLRTCCAKLLWGLTKPFDSTWSRGNTSYTAKKLAWLHSC
jgi:hypothetical protein